MEISTVVVMYGIPALFVLLFAVFYIYADWKKGCNLTVGNLLLTIIGVFVPVLNLVVMGYMILDVIEDLFDWISIETRLDEFLSKTAIKGKQNVK